MMLPVSRPLMRPVNEMAGWLVLGLKAEKLLALVLAGETLERLLMAWSFAAKELASSTWRITRDGAERCYNRPESAAVSAPGPAESAKFSKKLAAWLRGAHAASWILSHD